MADPQTTLHDLLAALRNSPAMLAKQAIGQAAAAQPSQAPAATTCTRCPVMTLRLSAAAISTNCWPSKA